MTRYRQAEQELLETGYLARQPSGYWTSAPGRAAFQDRVATFLLRTGKAKLFLSTIRGRPMRIIRSDQ